MFINERKVGRPPKYAGMIITLEDMGIYSPARIAHEGVGEFDPGFGLESEQLTAAREEHLTKIRKVRHTFARMKSNHKFPMYDDMDRLYGQSPTPGWYGWRWKRALALPLKACQVLVKSMARDSEYGAAEVRELTGKLELLAGYSPEAVTYFFECFTMRMSGGAWQKLYQ